MTRAERARLIDQQEFEAECKAARERAFAYVEECRQRERQKFRDWMGKPEVTPQHNMTTGYARVHTYSGLTLTVEQWAKRLGVKPSTLYGRQKKLGSMIAAIAWGTKGVKGKRLGVVSNLSASRETGAGGTAQDTSNITFQENSKCQQ